MMRKRLKISIPTSLEDITLGTYQKFALVASDPNNKDSLFLIQKTIEIFCNVPLSVVSQMSKRQMDSIATELTKMIQEKNGEVVKRMTYKGVKYGFMPKMEDMTAGEWVDLEQYTKDWSQMHKAMSVLYRPITVDLKDRWEIEDYKGSHDDMKDLPASVALDAVFFLIDLLGILEADLLRYLRTNPAVTTLPQWKEISTKSGDGSMPYMPSLSMISREWMRLPILTWRSSLHCLSTRKKKTKSRENSSNV